MVAKFVKAIVMVAVATSALSAEQFSGKRGDFWTGGSFNFLSLWASGQDGSQQIVMLNPVARFFPANGFCIGPKFSWTGMFADETSQNMIGLGIDLGYGGGESTFGYFVTSPHFVFMNSSYTFGTSSGSSDGQAFFLPFTAGTIFPVGRGIGLQLEAGYSLGFNLGNGSDKTLNAFTIGIGVCGIGETTAISIVNVFNLMTNAF